MGVRHSNHCHCPWRRSGSGAARRAYRASVCAETPGPILPVLISHTQETAAFSHFPVLTVLSVAIQLVLWQLITIYTFDFESPSKNHQQAGK